MDKAAGVEHEDIFAAYTQLHIEAGASDAGGARAHHDHAHILDIATGDFAGVQQCRAGNDGGAMLVIVEDRNIHGGLEGFFNDKAFRGLDVFEVDTAEGRFESFHHADELTGSRGLQAEVINVNVGKDLEQHALAFHDRFAGFRPDIAKAKHGSTVGNNGNEIGTAGVFTDQLFIFSNSVARFGNTGRIGEGKVFLGFAGLYRNNFQFAATGGAMVLKSFFASVKCHGDLLPKIRTSCYRQISGIRRNILFSFRNDNESTIVISCQFAVRRGKKAQKTAVPALLYFASRTFQIWRSSPL